METRLRELERRIAVLEAAVLAAGWPGRTASAMSAIGARRSRLTLRYHGAAVTLTAILAAGLLMAGRMPDAGPNRAGW